MTFSATTSILSQVGPNILDGNVLEPLGRFAEGRRPGVKRNNDGERSSGVKRTEPLRGSRRFLDSLSRIPFGNPATNESLGH